MDIENLFEKAEHPLAALTIAALVAIAAGMLVQWIGRMALLRITRRFSVADHLVHATAAPVQVLLPLIFLQMVWLTTPNDWTFMASVHHVTGIFLIATVTWLGVRIIDGVADMILLLRPVGDTADNLSARRIQTQTRVIARSLMALTFLIGVSLILMTFPAVRTVGASLLASAGLAGIVAGVAARPVLSNLIAGLQIALSQPLRIDDVLIVEGEFGRVEEIKGSYVVLALWDERRLVIPLQWFIENPFQNWTRTSSQLLGAVTLWVDYGTPLAPLRNELERICRSAPEWDGRVCNLQAVDTSERALQVRALISAADAGKAWDLRCRVREELLVFMQKHYANFLPRSRNSVIELLNEEDGALSREASARETSLPQETALPQKPAQPLPTRQ